MITIKDIKEKLLVVTGQAQLDKGVQLTDILRELDDSVNECSLKLPTRLKHFLKQRSYSKAVAFIEEEDLANG